MLDRPSRRWLAAGIGLLLLADSSEAGAQTPGPAATAAPAAAELSPDLTWADVALDPAREAEWRALRDQADLGAEAEVALVTARLSATGSDVAGLARGCFADQRCAAVREAEGLAARFGSAAELRAAIAAAGPVLQMLDLVQMTLDGKIAGADGDPLAAVTLLSARDQVFRSLMASVQQGVVRPSEDERVRRVIGSSLRLRVIRNDLEASARLSRVVDAVGWPSTGSWGPASRDAAWMIVQHADRAPDLQVAALRAMEDPDRRADYGPGRYALLYDRVTFALSGRQRYGTQVRCVDGRSVPAGLEQPAEVDARRAAMGLRPLQDYLAVVGDVCAAGR